MALLLQSNIIIITINARRRLLAACPEIMLPIK
jgi:hypothetical protein